MPLNSMEITTDTKNTITVLHRANPQLQNSIFKHITSISYAFLFIYADDGGGSLCHTHKGARMIAQNMLVFHITHHCWNIPHTTSLCSHPLFGFHKSSSIVNEHQWVQFFSTWMNAVTQIFFIHSSISDLILPDCSSAGRFSKRWKQGLTTAIEVLTFILNWYNGWDILIVFFQD